MTPFLSTPTLLPYTTLFRSQFYLMTGADPTTGVFTKDSATVTEYFGGNQNLNRGGRVTGHAPAAVQILVSAKILGNRSGVLGEDPGGRIRAGHQVKLRSEERRVGKECRCREEGGHSKKSVVG